MNFLKKWINCIVTFVAGVCGLAFAAFSGLVMKAMGTSQSVKAFDIITDAEAYTESKLLGLETEFVFVKAASIAMLVVAIILLVYSVVLLLRNLNVIKSESKVFDIVNYALIAVLVVVAIVLFVASIIYANGYADAFTKMAGIKITGTMGSYQPLMLAVSLVSAAVTGLFAFLSRKDA